MFIMEVAIETGKLTKPDLHTEPQQHMFTLCVTGRLIVV